MTAFPSYQDHSGAEPQYAAAPPPILVAAADPAPQRRWTVLLRIILAVPHLIVLEILTFVAGVVAFVGWWGALFTGRLPEFAVTFQSGYLRWYTRFNAYVCLLTDAWPPFSFDDDPGYPVRVAIPQAQRLNRAAVFFRCVLSVPAWFMIILLGQAMTPIGFVAWLITLITGRMPGSLHSAYLAVVRYQARVYGYAWLLLTPAYPGGLYGDREAAETWPDTPWLLRLTAGARRWVTAFIVIGALFLAGQTALNVVGIANGLHGFGAFSSIRGKIDRSQLGTSYAALNRTMTAWQSATVTCGHNLTCVTRQDARASRGFNTFADQMLDPLVPRGAAADQDRLIADARTLSHDFALLSRSATDAGYEQTFASTGLRRQLDTFGRDYHALAASLRSY